MEYFIAWTFISAMVFVVVFSVYKLIRFAITEDFSPDRYTYQTKDVDGEQVEYVVDKNEIV